MAKKGPCLHCGINYIEATPLWRNGPSDKPVLCNACGSRYKLKGHLDNYLPKNLQLHPHPKNLNDGSHVNVDEDELSNNVPPNDDENSNNSSPDFHRISARDFGDKVPSRKRSMVVYREMTAMEKFQKQLLRLYECQRKPNESASEESLLVNNVTNFIPNDEIGLGAMLIMSESNVASTESGSSHAPQ
ncbi:hypothetical protein Fmac_010107 [Flemingia macrophylla]|uniref:GATA-type domain-containing protein n=1 Tax=Flemingia macrophylla TaxID=520843 RepID=A0ABD1N304_9FABA